MQKTLFRLVFGFAVVLFGALALVHSVFASQPPRELFLEVVESSDLIHQGTCKVDSLKLDDIPCLGYLTPVAGIVWIVLFDQTDTDQPQVTHVVKVDPATMAETVVWCREDVCK